MIDNLEHQLAREDFSVEQAWEISTTSFRELAADREAREFIQNSPTISHLLAAAGNRFIAGPDRKAVLALSRQLHESSIRVSIDYMGEDTVSPEEIELATTEFVELLGASSDLGIDASVSINLSHIGLTVDKALAVENCRRVAAAATGNGTELIVNMEGDSYRTDILEIFWQLGQEYPTLGITLQACLERTRSDLARSLELPGRIRLVKGAYDELGDGAIRSRSVDLRFAELCEQLLDSEHRCSIATHDPNLLASAIGSLRGRDSRNVEIEMLYGVARHRLEVIRDLGHKVRAYLPYGTETCLYLCHRLAEYPPNLHFAMRDLVLDLRRRTNCHDHGREDPS